MSQNLHLIIGLGATGLSCARFLRGKNIPIAIADSRINPPNLAVVQQQYSDIPLFLGDFAQQDIFNQAAALVVSPGMSLQEPTIARHIVKGIPVVGDIELFVQQVRAPIIAITGTNAKSTVTTLVGEMAKTAGIKVEVGGNLGTPALELLSHPQPELYVLELSSFQLETTYSLKSAVATILNITPDHMDRYATVSDYAAAKHRIYHHATIAVSNRDDPATTYHEPKTKQFYFTLQEPRANEFGLRRVNGKNYLSFADEIWLPVNELPVIGRHYQANALAALALGHSYGLPKDAMLETLRRFTGLPHRCQLVRELLGVHWYNDSKGTNIGATLAALEGLGSEINGKIVLIAGGVGKNADFTELNPAIKKYVKALVLIGEAAQDIAKAVGDIAPVCFAKSMEEAVMQAKQLAEPKDCVLLSPACASYDMFKNFEHRGDVFSEVVKKIL